MIVFSKIVAAFITLPGIFLTLTLFISIYLLFQKKISLLIKILSVLMVVIMYITFTGLGVKIMVFPLEKQLGTNLGEREIIGHYPVVVLGGGIHHGTGLDKKGTLSASTLQRLVKGYKIYNKVNTKILFTGGVGVGYQDLSEAEVAQRWLQEMGVTAEDIVLEATAKNTFENGKNVKEWLDASAYEKIYLVTSAVHLPRAAAVFRNQDIEFIPQPAGYLYSRNMSWLDYLPNRGALNANMSAVHEWIGILWYLIRGYI